MSVDGRKAGRFDRYHPAVQHDPIDLGTFDLKQGESARLTVEIVGMNPEGVARQMFGLDYLKLEPAE